MRILIIGFVLFVIWAFFSSWLYVDNILPSMKEPVAVAAIPDPNASKADSLMKLKAMMPGSLKIYFEFNEAKFKPDQQIDLRTGEFKNWLEKYPESSLSATGYTDFVGTPDFNKVLGLKRAEVIQKYLEEKGIPKTRIVTDSKGKDQLLKNYFTEGGRASQRRVEVSIKQ
jgi:OOP family OmpA-OmpF porin